MIEMRMAGEGAGAYPNAGPKVALSAPVFDPPIVSATGLSRPRGGM
jgi:hypothetical protein